MRLLRLFLLCLAAVIALAALLLAAAFMPSVQTLIAQRVLDRHPELRATLGSLRARSGELAVQNLALVIDGAILVLPSAEAQLPVTAALRSRTLHLSRLTAKGWTLDLSGVASLPTAAPHPTPSNRAATPAPAPRPELNPAADALLVLHHVLTQAKLPPDLSIEEVDLEGDVLLPVGHSRDPISVHAIVRGGGLGAAREGTFTLDVQVPLTETTRSYAPLHLTGRLTLGLDAERSPHRLALVADAAARRGTWLDGLHAQAEWSAGNGMPRTETQTLQLSRGERRLVALAADFSSATRQLTGTWKADLRETDLAPFTAPRVSPTLALTGSGRFDAPADFTRLHFSGQLAGPVDRLGTVNSALSRVGPTAFTAEFDATHHDHALRLDRLQFSLGGERPVVTVRALQTLAYDETNSDVTVTDAQADGLEIALHELPLGWISDSIGGVAFSGAGLNGDLVVNARDGKFAVRSRQPLSAAGLAIHRAEKLLASDVTLSFPLVAELKAGSLKATASPFTVERGGGRLAQLELKASRAGEGKALKLEATWTANLDALATLPALEHFNFIAGHSASGSFTLLSDARTNFDGQFALTGRKPDRTLTATVHFNADANGRGTFYAPIKIALGRAVSEFNAEGSWTRPGASTAVNLTGDRVTLDHLALLAAPLAATGTISLPANVTALLHNPTVVPGVRDAAPFWGGVNARVSFDFAHLAAWGHPLDGVGGTFFLEPGRLRLEGGRAVFHQDRRLRAEATLLFDGKAALPYQLKGTASVDEIDAALLLGPPPPGREPVLHGKFAVAATFGGEGLNFKNLAWRTAQEIRLTSLKGGSTRLLETNVANALAEAPSPVSDTVGAVGSVFGKLLGTKSNVLQAEKNPVSPKTEAVLNFTYATKEFRYDNLAITAVRTGDGAIRIEQFEMTAPNEHLTGTGRIDYAKDRGLAGRPLTLELQLGLRGVPAKFLADAGLLPAKPDATGYTTLEPAFHFTGTLQQLDRTEWRDLLVKAATPPAPAKKSGN